MTSQVALVRSIAKAAHEDAIHLLATIEVLEAGNLPSRYGPIADRGGGAAMNLVLDALLHRVLLLALRPFGGGIVRSGDRHLAVAVRALEGDAALLREVVQAGGDDAQLRVALSVWARASGDERLGRVTVYRNKTLAHVAELPADFSRPRIRELLGFARLSAEVAERFAIGVGVAIEDASGHVFDHAVSAAALWSGVDALDFNVT